MRVVHVVLTILFEDAHVNAYVVTMTDLVASANEVVLSLSKRFLLQSFRGHSFFCRLAVVGGQLFMLH